MNDGGRKRKELKKQKIKENFVPKLKVCRLNIYKTKIDLEAPTLYLNLKHKIMYFL